MMIITCGQCQARFKVAPEQIKATGSKVRCSNCSYVFKVFRPGAPETAESEGSSREPEGGGGPPEDDGAESPRARRERRRRLYADQQEEEGADPAADWTEAGLDEALGRPPLRRRPPPPPPPEEPPEPEAPEAGDPVEETGDLEAEPADGLGLAADPARPHQAPPLLAGEDMPPPLGSPRNDDGGEVRAAVTRVKSRRHGLFLGLAIFCAALTIGIFYLSSRPEPLALSDGSYSPPPPVPGPGQPAAGPADPRGIEHITFTPKDNLKHFYRKNEKEGELLIITGRVRNSYPAPRSFIRLRGLLLDQHGNTLADRFVYAGNLISEEDLVTLPRDEIMARLNIQGGQNNQNMNIAPGREVPFMVVFDKVPLNKDEYRIIPVGSKPAE